MPASISGTSALRAELSQASIERALCSTWSSMRAWRCAADTRTTGLARMTDCEVPNAGPALPAMAAM